MSHAINFLIYFDISFDFEIKKKKFYLLQEKKREKKSRYDTTDSESDVLITLLSRHHK